MLCMKKVAKPTLRWELHCNNDLDMVLLDRRLIISKVANRLQRKALLQVVYQLNAGYQTNNQTNYRCPHGASYSTDSEWGNSNGITDWFKVDSCGENVWFVNRYDRFILQVIFPTCNDLCSNALFNLKTIVFIFFKEMLRLNFVLLCCSVEIDFYNSWSVVLIKTWSPANIVVIFI